MGKVIVEVAVLPVGSAGPSLGEYVVEVARVLERYPGLKTMLTPMATIIEGDWQEVFQAVREMHETPFRMGIGRVVTRISVDDRRDREFSMESKTASVKSRLQKKREEI